MEETKKWYQSRTVIAGVAGIIYLLLAIFGYVPNGLSSALMTEIFMGIISLLTIYFRLDATKQIQ